MTIFKLSLDALVLQGVTGFHKVFQSVREAFKNYLAGVDFTHKKNMGIGLGGKVGLL